MTHTAFAGLPEQYQPTSYVPSSTLINPGQAAHWRDVLEDADALLAVMERKIDNEAFNARLHSLRLELAAIAEGLGK